MRFAYATDLHGNRDAIEQLFSFANSERADAVVLGGDLTPKSVVIRLARFHDPALEDDECEDSPLFGGEILPVHLLERSGELATYSDCMRMILSQYNGAGSEKYAEDLVRKGTLIFEQTNHYYNFEAMLEEQVVLDKLLAFFGSHETPSAHVSLKLSEEEIDVVRCCVVDWFKTLEDSWNESQRDDFARKSALSLGRKSGSFDDLAPSKFIEECILSYATGMSMQMAIQAMESLLRKNEGPGERFLLKAVGEIKMRLVRAMSYKHLINRAHIAQIVEYSTIAQLKHIAQSMSNVQEGQEKFLKEYFLPLVREWRAANGGRPVYVMLGNDDSVECTSILDQAEQEGLVCHLHNRVHDFGEGFAIAGYSNVEFLPEKISYREWVKDGDGILSDLRSINAQIGGKPAVWVIHNPPFGHLDRMEKENVGSVAVTSFVKEAQPLLALFGHIHEAPRLLGCCSSHLGRTLCVNPGGEHNDGLQAVIIDTETLGVERRQG